MSETPKENGTHEPAGHDFHVQRLVSDFVLEVNKIIGPVIEICSCEDRPYPHFELRLAKTDYVMRDQVVLNHDDKFTALIVDLGRKYFKLDPGFSNTGRTFWFIGAIVR